MNVLFNEQSICIISKIIKEIRGFFEFFFRYCRLVCVRLRLIIFVGVCGVRIVVLSEKRKFLCAKESSEKGSNMSKRMENERDLRFGDKLVWRLKSLFVIRFVKKTVHTHEKELSK